MTTRNYDKVIIDYTNWRGERSKRKIQPLNIAYMSSTYHQEKQWILMAVDVAKKAYREFAVKDIHSWTPVKPTPPRNPTHE